MVTKFSELNVDDIFCFSKDTRHKFLIVTMTASKTVIYGFMDKREFTISTEKSKNLSVEKFILVSETNFQSSL